MGLLDNVLGSSSGSAVPGAGQGLSRWLGKL
jgi:hypothetical protein